MRPENVLIVHAHPEPNSFCSALKNTAVEVLQRTGARVELSDLYQMEFKAVADRKDFNHSIDDGFFKYQAEQKMATSQVPPTFAEDILVEQRKLARCDLVIFNFPMFWQGSPAILKGWFDRVLSVGFAYGNGKWFETSDLYGKRALITMTTGGMSERFSEAGLFGDIEKILHPLVVGTFNFIGLDVYRSFIAWGAKTAGDEVRKQYLEDYERCLQNLSCRQRYPFRLSTDYPDSVSKHH